MSTTFADAQPVGAELPKLARIAANPELLVELTTTEKFSFTHDELAAIQLAALRKRFRELVDRLPVLARFAETQAISDIAKLDDGALLLFPHTMYKSYPLSAIEAGRFDRLTKWLDTLTAHDLSAIDTTGCTSLDDWIDVLDTGSQVRVRHSSGTTGKLSFVPGSLCEGRTSAMSHHRYHQGFGEEPDADAEPFGAHPLIFPTHRLGASGAARTLDAIQRHFYDGDASSIFTTNPGRFSADMLSLGGRLENAQSKGELGRLALSPELLARRDAFILEQQEAPRRLDEFFATIANELKHRRVTIMGVVPLVIDMATGGLARGLESVFSQDSYAGIAGGSKGRTLPADYRELFTRFSGIPYPRTGYGMSEATASISRMCPAGHYHVPPNIIPYLVAPRTGAILPREGRQTGRYGIFDVSVQNRWGGFLSGDQVTMNFGDAQACSCGRRGAYIEGEIRRYSEAEGGDDKITCAGAPGVHDKALQFMSGVAE